MEPKVSTPFESLHFVQRVQEPAKAVFVDGIDTQASSYNRHQNSE